MEVERRAELIQQYRFKYPVAFLICGAPSDEELEAFAEQPEAEARELRLRDILDMDFSRTYMP